MGQSPEYFAAIKSRSTGHRKTHCNPERDEESARLSALVKDGEIRIRWGERKREIEARDEGKGYAFTMPLSVNVQSSYRVRRMCLVVHRAPIFHDLRFSTCVL